MAKKKQDVQERDTGTGEKSVFGSVQSVGRVRSFNKFRFNGPDKTGFDVMPNGGVARPSNPRRVENPGQPPEPPESK